MSVQERCRLAVKYSGHSKLRTLACIHEASDPVYVRLGKGPVWSELVPLPEDDDGLYSFRLMGKNVVEFPKTSGTSCFFTLTLEELRDVWRKHWLVKVAVRRNLDGIEAKLWAIPNGPMCKRMWNEVLS